MATSSAVPLVIWIVVMLLSSISGVTSTVGGGGKTIVMLPRLVPNIQISNLLVIPPPPDKFTMSGTNVASAVAASSVVYLEVYSEDLSPNSVYETRVSHRSTNPASFHLKLISENRYYLYIHEQQQRQQENSLTLPDSGIGASMVDNSKEEENDVVVVVVEEEEEAKEEEGHSELRRMRIRRRLATERLQICTSANGKIILPHNGLDDEFASSSSMSDKNIDPSETEERWRREGIDVQEVEEGEATRAVIAVWATFEGVMVAVDEKREPIRFNLILEPLVLGVIPHSALWLTGVLVPVVLLGLCFGVPATLRILALVDDRWPSIKCEGGVQSSKAN